MTVDIIYPTISAAMKGETVTTADFSYTTCPYCQQDTAGVHEEDCPCNPNNIRVTAKAAIYGYGWICPKCGSVYGPSVLECWRCNPPTPVITLSWV